MTFGAQQSQVLALLLRQWLVLVCAGVALGAALSAALMRFLTSMLFGIRPSDPATLVLVSALLAVVAVLACWVPARRAMCVDPVVALRHE